MRSAVACLFAVWLSACSSAVDSSGEPTPSGSPSAYDEDAVREGLATAFAGGNPRPRDLAAGHCFADRLLETTTPEQLREGGLVADDGAGVRRLPPLPDDLAGTAADAQLECVDVAEASARALTSVRKGDLDPAAYGVCLVAAVPPEARREALVATLTGRYDDPAAARLASAQVDCAAEQD